MRHQNPKGKEANAVYPADELRDAFYQIGNEMEKAFTLAAREMHSAFKKVSQDVKQKPPTETSAWLPAPTAEPKTPQTQFSATMRQKNSPHRKRLRKHLNDAGQDAHRLPDQAGRHHRRCCPENSGDVAVKVPVKLTLLT